MASIASYIDHTALKQANSLDDIQKLCEEAVANNFAAVCIAPYFINHAISTLQSLHTHTAHNVKVATVIGFPFGYSTISTKVHEIREAVAAGVDEVDIVATISAIKDNNWSFISEEIDQLMIAAREGPKRIVVKIIIESGILTEEQIIKCCEIYGNAKIDYLKTSTGYAEKGASIHTVQLFRKHLPEDVKIKASGGIRSKEDADAMVLAGADRIGTSSGIAIVAADKSLPTQSY